MTANTPQAGRRLDYRPVADLAPDPRNPKAHSVDAIDASIGRFGYVEPVVLDERTGFIISGHGRTKTLQAMEARGDTPPEGITLDDDGRWLAPVVAGWGSRTDSEAAAALIALNRTTELGGWEDDALLDLLDELAQVEGGFDGVGFDETEIERLRDSLDQIDGDDPLGDVDDDPTLEPSGRSFKDLDVLVGEPKHDTPHGAVYELGGRHLLVVAKLALEHDQWSHYLEGRMFAPYPDVYLALGELAKEQQLLMVQPSPYLAGHILDKWASVHGEDSIVQVNR